MPLTIFALFDAAFDKVEAMINPHKALREAAKQYAATGSVPSAIALAKLYLTHDRVTEAKTLFQCSAVGEHADDPELLLGLASAHFALREYQSALQCLNTLKQKHPESTTADGHLLYAKCLQELGRTGEAIHEFRALASYYSGPEPACRLGLLYKRIGDLRKAYTTFEGVLAHSRQMNEPDMVLHAEWLNIARNEVQKWAPLQPK